MIKALIYIMKMYLKIVILNQVSPATQRGFTKNDFDKQGTVRLSSCNILDPFTASKGFSVASGDWGLIQFLTMSSYQYRKTHNRISYIQVRWYLYTESGLGSNCFQLQCIAAHPKYTGPAVIPSLYSDQASTQGMPPASQRLCLNDTPTAIRIRLCNSLATYNHQSSKG